MGPSLSGQDLWDNVCHVEEVHACQRGEHGSKLTAVFLPTRCGQSFIWVHATYDDCRIDVPGIKQPALWNRPCPLILYILAASGKAAASVDQEQEHLQQDQQQDPQPQPQLLHQESKPDTYSFLMCAAELMLVPQPQQPDHSTSPLATELCVLAATVRAVVAAAHATEARDPPSPIPGTEACAPPTHALMPNGQASQSVQLASSCPQTMLLPCV